MKEKGFISNRIFDALASGAFMISDNIVGIEAVLGDAIVTYTDADDLKEKIDFYLSHPEERLKKSKKGINIVTKEHTFTVRAKQFSDTIQSMLKERSKGFKK